ncbi:NAD(P)-binding protein [Vibrio breoganii]|uniref:protoporphyrinogen/coproporphyrinogen oxidase n=1 Tax=Vibrio breoganii TaxID=553239 RepID=UPI000C83EE5C|nr:NAD(P)-binding protein [Vibrio breoganii]PML13664.1 hypothetical protein BCT84_13095 [Vibrio breoganii]
MKIGIIGAGISGLSLAKMLKKDHDVVVFEKESCVGGIARTDTVNHATYHLVGGHCFNSKNKEVLDFVFDEVLPVNEWHRVERKAKIFFKGELVSYPIEFSIQEIAKIDKDLAFRITRDFLNTGTEDRKDLESWFISKFGNTLAQEYLIPYNRKIWNNEPKNMSPDWVEGKLPIPNRDSFLKALISSEDDMMPHSSFYYPNTNNQNDFIAALASGINIKTDYNVSSLRYDKSINKWFINEEECFDKIVSTMPLDILPSIIDGVPESVLESARKLKYNKVSTMLWESQPTELTWTYDPSPDTLFHRHIHIGSFFSPKKNITITEAIGEHDYDSMAQAGKKIPYLVKPLAHNVSGRAYVVFDENYSESVADIMKYLESIDLTTLGRFGEWEYYNMDICIESALKVSKKFITPL